MEVILVNVNLACPCKRLSVLKSTIFFTQQALVANNPEALHVIAFEPKAQPNQEFVAIRMRFKFQEQHSTRLCRNG